jgi:beta-lactam-binding protein with PASTA domain
LRTRLPDAPGSLVQLVESLLDRDPRRRPEASTVAAALAGPLPQAQPAEPPTLAVPSEQPTALLSPPPGSRRRVLVALLASVAVIVLAFAYAGELRKPFASVPNVVRLREDAARAAIMHSFPAANVSVQRVYSTRVAAGLVISQQPLPRTKLDGRASVQLVVSRGTPFAYVPGLAGVRAASARASLARQGFASRARYEPSWTIRKGAVIGLQPRAGTYLHRPATVTVVVASGYPRAVVPEVRNDDLASAQSLLESRGLRYRLVYRLTDAVPPGQVMAQIPEPGISVYQGAQVRLTVSRTLHWVKVFSTSGTGAFESDAFTVPDRWRIRYRLAADAFGLALARFAWTPEGDLFGGGTFTANAAGTLRTYGVPDGAGTYRLSVRPYAGTDWYVEVDALR